MKFNHSNPDFEGVPSNAPNDLVDVTFTDKALAAAGVYQGGILDAR